MSQVSPTPSPEAGRRPRSPRHPGEGLAQLAPVIIESGASFEGLLTCRRAARIEGRFKGNVAAEDRIELGPAAEVSGRIEALDIVVAGSFDGELVASRRIQLLATARVTGELHARELAAAEGCTVTGLCRTGSASKPFA